MAVIASATTCKLCQISLNNLHMHHTQDRCSHHTACPARKTKSYLLALLGPSHRKGRAVSYAVGTESLSVAKMWMRSTASTRSGKTKMKFPIVEHDKRKKWKTRTPGQDRTKMKPDVTPDQHPGVTRVSITAARPVPSGGHPRFATGGLSSGPGRGRRTALNGAKTRTTLRLWRGEHHRKCGT